MKGLPITWFKCTKAINKCLKSEDISLTNKPKLKKKCRAKTGSAKPKERKEQKRKPKLKRKKAKIAAKRPQLAKPKMDKVNGKNKIKKSKN